MCLPIYDSIPLGVFPAIIRSQEGPHLLVLRGSQRYWCFVMIASRCFRIDSSRKVTKTILKPKIKDSLVPSLVEGALAECCSGGLARGP